MHTNEEFRYSSTNWNPDMALFELLLFPLLWDMCAKTFNQRYVRRYLSPQGIQNSLTVLSYKAARRTCYPGPAKRRTERRSPPAWSPDCKCRRSAAELRRLLLVECRHRWRHRFLNTPIFSEVNRSRAKLDIYCISCGIEYKMFSFNVIFSNQWNSPHVSLPTWELAWQFHLSASDYYRIQKCRLCTERGG